MTLGRAAFLTKVFALFYSDDIYCFVAKPETGFTICCRQRDAVNEQLVLLFSCGVGRVGVVRSRLSMSYRHSQYLGRDNIASSDVC